MKIIYHEFYQLPKLAWCVTVDKNESDIHVYHGCGVETFENFFVEGAWDGNFSSADFDKSFFFMGSGMKLEKYEYGEKLIFSTPNHTLERLYSILEQNVWFISNSLPFILSMTESNLDNEYLDYEKDFNSILKGINKYKRQIHLKNGKSVRLHYYCNIILDAMSEVQEENKITTGAFENYSHYHDKLLQALRLLVENAQAVQRKTKYGKVTTISKGYDSAAAAAMAYEVGCNIAVTFNKPQKYAEDCGEDIAVRLGYKNIIKKDANDYLNNEDFIEAEFLSSGELGSGIIFAAFEKEYSNNIVFMGERGDRIWNKNAANINSEMRFENEIFSDTSIIENRLKVGYIIMPVPLFGAVEWPSIYKISNSSEMNSYSTGNLYDRPIPRRILESRGVDREMFGIEKVGAGFNYRFDNLRRIRKRMSPKSFSSFYSYFKRHKRTNITVAKRWIKYIFENTPIYLSYIFNKIGLHINVHSITSDTTPNPGAPSYLFNWGMHEMMKRYHCVPIERITQGELCK